MSPYMKLQECAAYVQKSPRTLYKNEWKQKLGAFKNGGELVFPRERVVQYMEDLQYDQSEDTGVTPFALAIARTQNVRSLKSKRTDTAPVSLKRGVG